MFKNILVAIDRSVTSKQVFESALSLAKSTQSNLILLHVLWAEELGTPQMSSYFVCHKDRCIHVDPRIMRRANEEFDREWEQFKQGGLKLLRLYTKRAVAAGVQTQFVKITGHPSTTICDFAQSCHADIIVIGKRGHLGFKELFLGSVSNYVVHHSPCSVLVVRTPELEELSSTEELETTACA